MELIAPEFALGTAQLQIGFEGSGPFDCPLITDVGGSGRSGVALAYDAATTTFGYLSLNLGGETNLTDHDEICVDIFAEVAGQQFELKIESTEGTNTAVRLKTEEPHQWNSHCVYLSDYPGVDLVHATAITVGFNEELGDASVYLGQIVGRKFAVAQDCRGDFSGSGLFVESGSLAVNVIVGPDDKVPPRCSLRLDSNESLPLQAVLTYDSALAEFGFFSLFFQPPYDLAVFDEICLTTFAELDNQRFELKIEDGSEASQAIILNHEKQNQWQRHCVPLPSFPGVSFEQTMGITIGFNESLGDAALKIAQFQLR